MHRQLGRVLRERDKAAGQWRATVALILAMLEPQLFDEEDAWAKRKKART